jgi:hypothetical protein
VDEWGNVDAAKDGSALIAAGQQAVADMMAEPRSSVKYANVFPEDEGWEQATRPLAT